MSQRAEAVKPYNSNTNENYFGKEVVIRTLSQLIKEKQHIAQNIQTDGYAEGIKLRHDVMALIQRWRFTHENPFQIMMDSL